VRILQQAPSRAVSRVKLCAGPGTCHFTPFATNDNEQLLAIAAPLIASKGLERIGRGAKPRQAAHSSCADLVSQASTRGDASGFVGERFWFSRTLAYSSQVICRSSHCLQVLPAQFPTFAASSRIRPRSFRAPQLQPCQRGCVSRERRPGAGAGGLPGISAVRQESRTETVRVGDAHFLETHWLFQGAASSPPREFDRRIEGPSVGSSHAATASGRCCTITLLIPPGAAHEALGTCCWDLVLDSPPPCRRNFGMEKQVVLEELARAKDSLKRCVQRLAALAVSRANPYGRPILAEPARPCSTMTRNGWPSLHRRRLIRRKLQPGTRPVCRVRGRGLELERHVAASAFLVTLPPRQHEYDRDPGGDPFKPAPLAKLAATTCV